MHFKSLILMSTMCVMVSACSEKRQNPLMTESDAPYGIINYEQITIDDYREAMQEGMRQQKANIEARQRGTMLERACIFVSLP